MSTNTIPYFEVHAFTKRCFAGNPAGVCLLEHDWLPDAKLQAIAAETNLADTAFGIARTAYFELRWRTPMLGVDLFVDAELP